MYSVTVLSLNMEENFFLKSGLSVWTSKGPLGGQKEKDRGAESEIYRERVTDFTSSQSSPFSHDLSKSSNTLGVTLTKRAGQSEPCEWVKGAEDSPQGLDPHGDGPVLICRVRTLRKAPRLHQDQVLHPAGEAGHSPRLKSPERRYTGTHIH